MIREINYLTEDEYMKKYCENNSQAKTLNPAECVSFKKKKTVIENVKTPMYNENILAVKGKNNMSIVGFIRCNDGVLAFGDTKGTIFNTYHDKERGEIRKVFRNEKCMLITFGLNTVCGEKIEDIIQKMMNNNKDLTLTMTDIKDYIVDRTSETYNFFGYDFETNSIHEYIINCLNEDTGEKYFFTVLCSSFDSYGGANDYVKYLDILINNHLNYKKNDDVIKLLSIEEMKKMLNSKLGDFIKMLDNSLNYNPVGLPLIFEAHYYNK